MSLSQIELVWVRVRVERECFGVNLREDNKVSESKMAEFKMAAITKLSQNQWDEVCFVKMVGTNLGKCEGVWKWKTKMAESKMAKLKMAEFKMATIMKWSENEWVWVRLN